MACWQPCFHETFRERTDMQGWYKVAYTFSKVEYAGPRDQNPIDGRIVSYVSAFN